MRICEIISPCMVGHLCGALYHARHFDDSALRWRTEGENVKGFFGFIFLQSLFGRKDLPEDFVSNVGQLVAMQLRGSCLHASLAQGLA